MKKNILKLRRIKYTDLSSDWVRWLNDKVVTKYSEKRFQRHTIKSQKDFLRNKLKSKSSLLFGVFFSDKHLGNIELSDISQIHKHCEIRYFIGKKDYWNKGIGAKSINKALNVAFNKLKLKKIYAFTYSNNLASQKVLKKNGFNIEGKMGNFYQYKNRRVKKIIFGLNKVDFKNFENKKTKN